MLQDILCALKNRVLDIKNYHLLVRDKEQSSGCWKCIKPTFPVLKGSESRETEDGEQKSLCIHCPSC